MTPSPEIETVKDVVVGTRLLSHLKDNRLEYIGLTIILHLLGVSDHVLGYVNGVCF